MRDGALLRASILTSASLLLFMSAPRAQQAPAIDTSAWTAADDHRNMMEQLGIKALRPGPSGNDQAPNHANYAEATANPFPVLPDALTLKNGQTVTSADMWWKQRRPEIVEDFEREVIGRFPKNVPKVTWTVTQTADATWPARRSSASGSWDTWTTRPIPPSTSTSS
jgi:hypothetical protein